MELWENKIKINLNVYTSLELNLNRSILGNFFIHIHPTDTFSNIPHCWKPKCDVEIKMGASWFLNMRTLKWVTCFALLEMYLCNLCDFVKMLLFLAFEYIHIDFSCHSVAGGPEWSEFTPYNR